MRQCLFSSSSAFPVVSLGFAIFSKTFANHRGSDIPSLWIKAVSFRIKVVALFARCL